MQILGLVENMSGLKCPNCGNIVEIFKTGGGRFIAEKENLKLLGTLPIEPKVVSNGDIGNMSLLDDSTFSITQEFNKIVNEVVKLTGANQEPSLELPKVEPGNKENLKDKKILVVPVSGGKLDSHFGHCEQFAFVETQNGKIVRAKMHNPPAHEPGVLPQWIYDQGADVAIVGGMGINAQNLLKEKGIEVIIGAPKDSPVALVNQYLSKTLVTGENICDH
jgi:predicted Fe-Mo cluster-binding NifX family protein